MDDYTHLNIRELEDQAPKHGQAPNIQARSAREPLQLARSGVGLYRYAPGFRTFGHRHTEQEEIYVVLSGSGRAKIGKDIVDLKPWDALRVSATAIRAFEAGPDGLELMVFGSPSDRNKDAKVIPDWWDGNEE